MIVDPAPYANSGWALSELADEYDTRAQEADRRYRANASAVAVAAATLRNYLCKW